MLPQVQEFISTAEAIKKEVDEAYEAYRRQPSLTEEEYATRRETYVKLRDGQYDKVREAGRKLAEATDDKLVKFIVERYLDDYYSSALTVLRRLPATAKELDDLAAEEGWCGVWDTAVDEAIEAGAMEINEIEQARRKVKRYLRNELYEQEAERAMKLVDEYVKLRVDEAVANLAKTANVVMDALSGQ